MFVCFSVLIVWLIEGRSRNVPSRIPGFVRVRWLFAGFHRRLPLAHMGFPRRHKAGPLLPAVRKSGRPDYSRGAIVAVAVLLAPCLPRFQLSLWGSLSALHRRMELRPAAAWPLFARKQFPGVEKRTGKQQQGCCFPRRRQTCGGALHNHSSSPGAFGRCRIESSSQHFLKPNERQTDEVDDPETRHATQVLISL